MADTDSSWVGWHIKAVVVDLCDLWLLCSFKKAQAAYDRHPYQQDGSPALGFCHVVLVVAADKGSGGWLLLCGAL